MRRSFGMCVYFSSSRPIAQALLLLTSAGYASSAQYLSLHQKDERGEGRLSKNGGRSQAEKRAFNAALSEMLFLYASPRTTVLQLSSLHIPPRPREFDGQICLYEVDTDDLESVKNELQRFGRIQACSLKVTRSPSDLLTQSGTVHVTFTTHEAALNAMTEGPPEGLLSQLCEGIATVYNERPYAERGWCQVEAAVACATSVVGKVICVETRAPVAVDRRIMKPEQMRQRVIDNELHFTGSAGDKERLPELYSDFYSRAVQYQHALRRTMAWKDHSQVFKSFQDHVGDKEWHLHA